MTRAKWNRTFIHVTSGMMLWGIACYGLHLIG